MNWMAHLLLMLFVSLSSLAIGWVWGRESGECRRQGEPPCSHDGVCAARRRRL